MTTSASVISPAGTLLKTWHIADIISAAMVVFTMAVSEFGVPKVIGANYSVLAIDIYKQVIGQQNLDRKSVV